MNTASEKTAPTVVLQPESAAVRASADADASPSGAGDQQEQAIRMLAEASRRGNVEAMTRLGRRLLVGAHAPYRPEEGTDLLVKAANLGGAEAAAQVAVLAAIGLHVKQSWRTALAAIVFSAELGWPAARGQLRVLAADRDLAAQGDGGERTDPKLWRKLADAIDLNHWHTPAAGFDLSDSPLVRCIPDFAPAEVCAWIIERARGRLTRAQVYDAVAGSRMISKVRTNTWALFDVTQCDLVSVLMQAHMCANTGVSFRCLEPCVVLHYDVGEEATEHFDFVDPRTPNYERELAENGQRIVTFLVYLNEDYAGGETEMPRLGISHKGRRGEGLFFVNALENGEPDMRTLHAGRPPVRGEKWLVSQFMRDRPVF